MSGTAGEGEPLADPHRIGPIWSGLRGVVRFLVLGFLRYRVRGVEHVPRRGGALLLVNHQSFLDPVLVGLPLERPVSFLARRSLFRVPVIGPILRATHVMPIDRVGVTPSSIKEAVRRMRHGFLVGIFPEGTRTLDGRVGEFRTGFATLVRRGRVPVLPVGVAGAFEAFPRTARFPRPATIRVVFGKPLEPDVMRLLEDRRTDEFAAIARDRVVACFEEAQRWRLER